MRVAHDKIQRVREGDFSMVLVGPHVTWRKKEVPEAEAQSLAQTLNCPYFKTSVKDKYVIPLNVEDCFFELIREMRKRPSHPR